MYQQGLTPSGMQPLNHSPVRSEVWDPEGSSLVKVQVRMQRERLGGFCQNELCETTRGGLGSVNAITWLKEIGPTQVDIF